MSVTFCVIRVRNPLRAKDGFGLRWPAASIKPAPGSILQGSESFLELGIEQRMPCEIAQYWTHESELLQKQVILRS
jgi:hypothetical protein